MGKARPFFAGLCWLLAFLLTIPALVAYWGHRTVLVTENYVATMVAVAANERVQQSLAATTGEAVKRNLDVAALVDDTIGGAIKNPTVEAKIDTALTEALPPLVDRVTAEVLASDQFQTIWADTNTVVNRALLAALSGDTTGPTTLTDGKLVLDTSALIDQVKTGLVARGFDRAADLNVPVADRQIVLLDSAELAQAQQIYRWADPVSAWFIWVVVALFVVALLLSIRRGRMLGRIGWAALLNGALLLGGWWLGQDVIAQRFSGEPIGPAMSVFYDTLIEFLRTTAIVMVIGGAIVIGATWLIGRARAARRRRTAPLAPGTGAAGSADTSAVAPDPAGTAGAPGASGFDAETESGLQRMGLLPTDDSRPAG